MEKLDASPTFVCFECNDSRASCACELSVSDDTKKRIAEIKARYNHIETCETEVLLKPSVLFSDIAWLLEQVERLNSQNLFLQKNYADKQSDCRHLLETRDELKREVERLKMLADQANISECESKELTSLRLTTESYRAILRKLVDCFEDRKDGVMLWYDLKKDPVGQRGKYESQFISCLLKAKSALEGDAK